MTEERARQKRQALEKEAKRADKKKKRQRVLRMQIGLICLVVLALGYTIFDKVTDGRKIGCRTSVDGQKISHLSIDEATDTVAAAFENTELVFKENKKTVYRVTLGEAGYSLNREVLKEEIEKIKKNQKSCLSLLQLPRKHHIEYRVEEQAEKRQQHFQRNSLERQQTGRTLWMRTLYITKTVGSTTSQIRNREARLMRPAWSAGLIRC